MPFFLFQMAEISNVIAICLVLLLLAVMLSYLYRLTTSHDFFSAATSTVFYPQKQLSLPMVKVQNPFTFSLTKTNTCTLEEVHCIISSQYPCTINSYWAVNLYSFHAMLELNWPTLKQRLSEESFLTELGGYKSPTQSFDSVTDQCVTLKPPTKINKSELGIPPRHKYPLVVLIVREDSCNELNSVVMMALVIHLMDEQCVTGSRVLLQYLKQANGRTCSLKPLYIPESDNSSYENSDIDNLNRICVVCQTNTITHVCLPCRHTCVCESCFSLIDKCPLCRSLIQSFFCVNDHSTDTDTAIQDDFPLRHRNI